MKHVFYSLFAIVACLLVACDDGNDEHFINGLPNGGNTPGGGSNPTDLTTSAELFNFDVEFNDNFLSENETIDKDDDDYVENTKFSETVTITFDGSAVSYDALPDGVSAEVSGADIVVTSTTSSNIIYHLSGTSSNGMFKIYSDKKFAVEISNLTLTNNDGPAINIQSKKRVFICLDDNSENTLADASPYADTGNEDAKGVIFSEGQLVFSGGGRLTVEANCKAGISSDQYLRFRQGNVIDVTASEGNAVRGKDSIIVSGGVMNLSVSGLGNKGMKSDGPVRINGGRTTVINSAEAYYDSDEADTKGPAGVNCDGDFTMSGGELDIKATGIGGKGISADGEFYISDGKIRVITTGTKFVYGSSSSGGGPNRNSSSDDLDKSPKGIRSEGAMTISGGDIMSRTTGGTGSEAIESKSTLTINSGSIQAYAYDDAINSAENMYLAGGDIWAVSSSNDGIDSNGNMYISGGTIITFGLGEDGVDVIERGTLSITGGTLFSLGNTCMTTPSSVSTQEYIYKRDVSDLISGVEVSLKDNASSTLFNYTMPFTISRAYMILSLPSLTKGNSYTFSVGSSSETVSL